MPLKTVHIAGTNGKGSVAAMVSEVLRTAGYATGTYTSPHLISFTERITVNGEPIREEEVVELTQFIKERIGQAETGAALHVLRFHDRPCLSLLQEKGRRHSGHRGGARRKARLDERDTSPRDGHHERRLRPPGVPGAHDRGDRTGKGGCREGTRSRRYGRRRGRRSAIIRARRPRPTSTCWARPSRTRRKDEQVMWYRGIHRTFDDLSIALRGDHQLFNAALALCTLGASRRRGLHPERVRRQEGVRLGPMARAGSSSSGRPGNPPSSSTARTTPRAWPPSPCI